VDEDCCYDCPSGTECDLQDNTLESIKIAPEHWRVDKVSTDIRFCSNSREACEGGTIADKFRTNSSSLKLGSGYCKANHYG
jgi:hypothetical protein